MVLVVFQIPLKIAGDQHLRPFTSTIDQQYYEYHTSPMHGTNHSLAICIISMAESSSQRQQYIVHFDGNNSKRWDGKEV